MRIGIIGGTGPAGRGLAVRSAAAGHDVIIGSRDAQRAQEVAEGLSGQSERTKGSIAGGTNDDAAQQDLVVVATPLPALPPPLVVSFSFPRLTDGR